MEQTMVREEVVTLIEDGVQVGHKDFVVRSGCTFRLTVGIQKHAGNYKTVHRYYKIDLEGSPYCDDPEDVWENLIFNTLEEAEKFIFERTGFKLEALRKPRPTKGSKNEGYFSLTSFH